MFLYQPGIGDRLRVEGAKQLPLAKDDFLRGPQPRSLSNWHCLQMGSEGPGPGGVAYSSIHYIMVISRIQE